MAHLLAGIVAVGGFLALILVSGLWWAYCLSILWAWFAVPIWGLPVVGVWELFATKLLLSGLMPHGAHPKETDGFGASLARSILIPPMFLLVGWLVKSFM